jgi:hypothetical protein
MIVKPGCQGYGKRILATKVQNTITFTTATMTTGLDLKKKFHFYIVNVLFLFCFFTRSGRPALANVPDTINCRILISEYVHVYIISSAFFLEWGYHSRRSPIQVPTVPMLLHFCTRNRGNMCFNIVRLLALEFGLLRMVREPSADAHVI